MRAKLMLILFLLTGLGWGDDAEFDGQKLSGYEVKDVSLEEAILELNRVITEDYPGRRELLVAFVANTRLWTEVDLEELKLLGLGDPREPQNQKITIKLKKGVRINTVVQYLVDLTRFHWRVYEKQVVIYGLATGEY